MKTPAPKILLIEKDEVTLEIYQRELKNSFNVYGFTDIDGVLEVLTEKDIAAVVIEPETCGGQGWELIDSLPHMLPDRPVPVIVCTTRDANRGIHSEAIAMYLTKPVFPKTLREKILEVLNSR